MPPALIQRASLHTIRVPITRRPYPAHVFTGLIQHLGVVVSRTEGPTATRLCIDSQRWNHQPALGDSIAINGCCLTVVDWTDGIMAFDVVPTTLDATTLGTLAPGQAVHLEHATTPTTLLGGHLVQGHVDGTGRVLGNGEEGQAGWLLHIEPPGQVDRVLVEKGSIAVNGVSLTIAHHTPGRLTIALIPETLERTTLGALAPGDLVNLEADYLAKMVEALIERRHGTLS